MADPAGADGQRKHAGTGRGGDQCGRARWPRYVGKERHQAARRIAGFRQQSGGSLNVNYPIWPDPRCAPDASGAMRQHLQVQYDAFGLGRVPNRRAK